MLSCSQQRRSDIPTVMFCLYLDHDVWSTQWFSPDGICLLLIYTGIRVLRDRGVVQWYELCLRMWPQESAIPQFVWYVDILVSLDSWCRSMFGFMFQHSWVPGLVMLVRIHVGVTRVLRGTSILRWGFIKFSSSLNAWFTYEVMII